VKAFVFYQRFYDALNGKSNQQPKKWCNIVYSKFNVAKKLKRMSIGKGSSAHRIILPKDMCGLGLETSATHFYRQACRLIVDVSRLELDSLKRKF
jgi:hypothetical protein